MTTTGDPNAQPPNPFSREGSSPDPGGQPSWPAYPSEPVNDPYPQPSANPYSQPSANPYAEPPASRPSAPDPGFDRQPTPPYGSSGQAGGGYGVAPDPYASPDPYATPATNAEVNPYETNSYASNPYQPSYGGYGSYGVVPTQHPQAVLAMVLGIVGIVTSTFCVGGLVGIPALIIGRKVRREIDETPGRYEGRGMATAGIVLGIISIVLMALFVVFVVIAVMVDPN